VQRVASRGELRLRRGRLTHNQSATYAVPDGWFHRCNYRGSPNVIGQLGGTLTVIYSAQSVEPQTKTRNVLLPLLVVLFIVSYGILTLLVVEQGQTIEAQRSLLREMLKDSRQLATLKDKLAREVAVQTPQKGSPQAQQKEVPAESVPGLAPKAPAKETKRPTKSARVRKETPEKPAADLQDVRRSTREI
jgi:hypothetical protein